MKILAYKPGGGSIVELGERETELISQLSSAMTGQAWQPKAPRNYEIEGDMEKAFLAVIYFIQVKFAVNEIKSLANELDKAIGLKNEL